MLETSTSQTAWESSQNTDSASSGLESLGSCISKELPGDCSWFFCSSPPQRRSQEPLPSLSFSPDIHLAPVNTCYLAAKTAVNLGKERQEIFPELLSPQMSISPHKPVQQALGAQPHWPAQAGAGGDQRAAVKGRPHPRASRGGPLQLGESSSWMGKAF